MKQRVLGMAAVATFGFWAGAGHALEDMPLPEPETTVVSPAVKCLQNGSKPLEYPMGSQRRGDAGTVKVSLQFHAPDQGPTVTVLDGSTKDPALVEAVVKYLGESRVPCMQAGDAVSLRVDYAFRMEDSPDVTMAAISDEADPQRRKMLACVRRSSDSMVSDRPKPMLGVTQGKVLVQVTFTAPTAEPQIKVLARSDERLARAVVNHMQSMRLPCMGTDPITSSLLYDFRIDGNSKLSLKDMSLLSFLQSATDVPRPVSFNLDTLGCPFKARVTYMRPHQDNKIEVLTAAVPERQPFLDWIARIAFDLDEMRNTRVLGESFVLSVPCGTVDL